MSGTPRYRSRRRARQRGYTLVELMMALALFIVGVLAIMSLQRIMIASNTSARNSAVAEQIAKSWAAQLEMDANAWRTDLTSVTWLSAVDDNGTWFRPTYNDSRRFGAGFDDLGNPLSDSDADVASARFCTNIRLTWLYADKRPDNSNSNNGTMRAEIRVFWLRDGQSTLEKENLCKVDANTADIGQAVDSYRFIYQTTAIRQHAS